MAWNSRKYPPPPGESKEDAKARQEQWAYARTQKEYRRGFVWVAVICFLVSMSGIFPLFNPLAIFLPHAKVFPSMFPIVFWVCITFFFGIILWLDRREGKDPRVRVTRISKYQKEIERAEKREQAKKDFWVREQEKIYPDIEKAEEKISGIIGVPAVPYEATRKWKEFHNARARSLDPGAQSLVNTGNVLMCIGIALLVLVFSVKLSTVAAQYALPIGTFCMFVLPGFICWVRGKARLRAARSNWTM